MLFEMRFNFSCSILSIHRYHNKIFQLINQSHNIHRSIRSHQYMTMQLIQILFDRMQSINCLPFDKDLF